MTNTLSEAGAKKFVLIGGGIASVDAAKAIRSRDQNASITVVCGESALPYNRPALSDLIERGLSFGDIALGSREFYDARGIDLRIGVQALRVDRKNRRACLADGTVLRYDKLLLATGSNCVNPLPPSDGGVPVRTLRSYKDAMDILSLTKKYTSAAVVGGGILGVETAMALQARGVRVSIVERMERIMIKQADEVASGRLTAMLRENGIRVFTSADIEEVTQTGLRLAGGKSVRAGFIVVSAGVRAECALARECGLKVNRGVIVDEYMATDDPDIFAAGDCAEFNGRTGGLWSTASFQARTAAASMRGERLPYTQTTPAAMFDSGGVKLFSGGEPGGPRSKIIRVEDRPTGAYAYLSFGNDALEGVVLLGDTRKAAKAMAAIQSGLPPKEALGQLVF